MTPSLRALSEYNLNKSGDTGRLAGLTRDACALVVPEPEHHLQGNGRSALANQSKKILQAGFLHISRDAVSMRDDWRQKGQCLGGTTVIFSQ